MSRVGSRVKFSLSQRSYLEHYAIQAQSPGFFLPREEERSWERFKDLDSKPSLRVALVVKNHSTHRELVDKEKVGRGKVQRSCKYAKRIPNSVPDSWYKVSPCASLHLRV